MSETQKLMEEIRYIGNKSRQDEKDTKEFHKNFPENNIMMKSSNRIKKVMPLINVSESFKSVVTGDWLGYKGYQRNSLFWLAATIQNHIDKICISSDFKDIKNRLSYIDYYNSLVKEQLSLMIFREVY